MVVVTVEVSAGIVVLLITGKDIDVVRSAAEVALVLCQILLVQGEVTAVGDGCGAIGTGRASEHAVQGIAAGVVIVDAGVDLEGQVLDRSDDRTEFTYQDVCGGEESIVLVVTDCVSNEVRTDEVRVVGVVDLTAVLGLEAAIGITDIQRIDRTDHIGQVEEVSGRSPAAVVAVGLGVGKRVADIGLELDPGPDLVVSVYTGSVTLVSGIVDETTVIEVTEAGVVVEIVRSAAHGEVVLLTERVVEHLIVPVVRLIVVLTVAVTELGVGVQLEVGTDELLPFRKGIDLISETSVEIVIEVLVSIGVGLCYGMAGIIILAVHQLIVSLIVLTGIGDNVVLRDETAVGAEPRIELHHSLASLALLGGDEDDAVCSAVSVDGGSRSILEDGHGLYVVRVDVGDGSAVGSAVNHDERAVACTQRADTTDADGRGAAGRVTGGGDDLDTGGGAREGVGHTGGDLLLDLLALHHGGRAGEGGLGGRTVSHDDGLVDELGIGLERYVDGSAALNRNDQSSIAH